MASITVDRTDLSTGHTQRGRRVPPASIPLPAAHALCCTLGPAGASR
jgi:hypothetical protein